MRGVAFVVHSASGTFREEEAQGVERDWNSPVVLREKMYGIIIVAWFDG